jgi:hypothetical protein
MNCTKSIFLFVAVLFSAAAYANCPDPKDIKPQTGIQHPHWITENGWVSDAEVTDEQTVPVLRYVYIVNPPPPPYPRGIIKPIRALRCAYSNDQNESIIFNMHEPFALSSSQITTLGHWNMENPAASGFRISYTCLHEPDNKCEFTFDGVKSNDVKDYQSPFGNDH